MFGFLRGPTDATYRRCYARCCSFQHALFGPVSMPLLSYEGVFLYTLACDSGWIAPLLGTAPTCCKMQTSRRLLHAADATVGKFCAAVGMLLASIKLEDDIRDGRSWLARFARWKMNRSIRLANSLLAEVDGQFPNRAQVYVQRHLELESGQENLTVDQYVVPTAAAFADLFALFGRLPGHPCGNPHQQLGEIGYHVGAAIIAADCAADWQRDQRLGQFNPLRCANDVRKANIVTQQHLAAAGFACVSLAGDTSVGSRVIRATFNRQASQPNPPGNRTPPATRTSLIRRLRGGDCDCFCDCPTCDGPGCDGPDCCTNYDGPTPCIEACFCCECCCDPERRANRSSKKAESSGQLLGRVGRANGSLRPSGAVVIDGVTHPARSDQGFIERDSEVKVIKQDHFGVVVRRVDERENEKD